MILLDQNSNGDVIAYEDVHLFRSYISAALDHGVLQHKLIRHRPRFLRTDDNRARSFVTIGVQRRAMDPAIVKNEHYFMLSGCMTHPYFIDQLISESICAK